MEEIKDSDLIFMSQALDLAREAYGKGEVPIGCVITYEGSVIAKAHNTVEATSSCLKHAEMNAIEEAIGRVGYKNLHQCQMFITLEPCSMCAGAIVLARIERVVIAAEDPKSGAAGSIFQVLDDKRLNHRCKVEYGLLKEESSRLLRDFFKELRIKKKNEGKTVHNTDPCR